MNSRSLYPPIEPYRTERVDVGDGHQLHVEWSGTAGAKPAVFLHGGPGAGISPDHRRLFDPSRYDVLLLDQRGCGRSTPRGGLHANTTWDLVDDIERLRRLTGVERWQVFGGSWGTTLALAYAQRHPASVSELVLRGVFLGSRTELDWFYQHGTSELFPEQWQRFVAIVPAAERGDLRAAYGRLLATEDQTMRGRAARAWSAWEAATASILPDPAVESAFAEPDFADTFALLESHYFSHGCWLEEGQLLRDAHRLARVPGTIVHGRYDAVCPASSAHALNQAWGSSSLHVVEGAGHAWSEPGILDRLIQTTDAYASDDSRALLA